MSYLGAYLEEIYTNHRYIKHNDTRIRKLPVFLKRQMQSDCDTLYHHANTNYEL